MRCRYCILIVLTIFILKGAFAQGWEWQNPLPSGFDYKSVVMFESREWLISTNNAILLRTSDSGITWSFERNQGDRYSYSKLKFIKGKLWGIAIDGTKNNLCVSTDRGKSFHLLRSPAGDM